MRKVRCSVLILIAVVGFISACEPNPARENINIPRTDIIYQAINIRIGGGESDKSNNLVGFVNADGSGKTLIRLSYRAYRPVMSREIGGIFFGSSVVEPLNIWESIGPTYFLSITGEYKVCDHLIYSGFIFPIKGSQLLLESATTRMDLVDIKTCKVVKTLLEIPENVPWKKYIGSAAPSNSGDKVIFNEYYRSPEHDEIYILDITTDQIVDTLQSGFNSSFSPDDKRIVYVGSEGIYIANMDGSQAKLIIPISFRAYDLLLPFPFWSPDGSTLIYHKCINQTCKDVSDFSIYKFDLKSGLEQKIVDGGLYPYWAQ